MHEHEVQIVSQRTSVPIPATHCLRVEWLSACPADISCSQQALAVNGSACCNKVCPHSWKACAAP